MTPAPPSGPVSPSDPLPPSGPVGRPLVHADVGVLGPRVGRVRLDDPDRRNALVPEVVDGIVAAFDRFEGDEGVGAVVVHGAPPAFCAGGSLADLEQLGSEADARRIYEGFLRVARCPLPTIAAVDGAAVGAGFNLALACDVRLATPRARFDSRFLALGLHPGGGSTFMLRHIVGDHSAAAMILFGQVLDGPEAARVGLAWRCVGDDELLALAGEMAARAAAFRALAVRTKATLAALHGLTSLDQAVAVEVEAQLWSIAQPDFAERLAALQAQIAAR